MGRNFYLTAIAALSVLTVALGFPESGTPPTAAQPAKADDAKTTTRPASNKPAGTSATGAAKTAPVKAAGQPAVSAPARTAQKPSVAPGRAATAAPKQAAKPVPAPVRTPAVTKANLAGPGTKVTSSVVRTSTPDGQQPVWLKLQDGLSAAKATGKYVIVDVYTEWCHFCHKLDKEVLSVPPVAPFIAQNMVAVRLNAEDGGEGQRFARQVGVRAYPSTVFLDSNGRLLDMVVGFAPADTFLSKLRGIDEQRKKGVKGQALPPS